MDYSNCTDCGGYTPVASDGTCNVCGATYPARGRRGVTKLREALDLIEFAMSEAEVDRAAVRALVDDVRRTLFLARVNPDLPVVEAK